MTEDVSATIRIAVTIMLVAALVATVLNVIFIAQNAIASGVSKFTSSLDSFNKQEFDKYDQKSDISGSEVKAAISAYAGQDVAVCVATVSSGTTFYNFNGVLDGASYTDGNKSVTLAFVDSNTPYYKGKLRVDEATMVPEISSLRKGINTPGTAPYIRESGRFSSNLIINEAGDTIGIAFKQNK